MKKILVPLLTSSLAFLTACDTSINKQVEKKFEKAQHDVLSPTARPIDIEESKNGAPQHGVHLPELQGSNAASSAQNVLIPAEQFNSPHPQTKLKSDALKWQEANLQTSDHDDGTVILIE